MLSDVWLPHPKGGHRSHTHVHHHGSHKAGAQKYVSAGAAPGSGLQGGADITPGVPVLASPALELGAP